MASKVKGVPDGASVVIPRLVCRDPVAAVNFCGPAMIMIEGEWTRKDRWSSSGTVAPEEAIAVVE